MTEQKKETSSLVQQLERQRPALIDLLPKSMTIEKFWRTIMVALAKTPKLKECYPASVIEAVLRAAELGLEVSGTNGYAYLVPYGKIATLIIGYRGLADLARRSGGVRKIEARVVYAGDAFAYEYGLKPKLVHVPGPVETRGDLVFVYAVATLDDGDKTFEVMPRIDVEAIRSKSRAGNSGPWVDFFPEMARKTVVRRICKLLPQSPELARALEVDEDTIEGEVTERDDDPTPTSMERAKRRLQESSGIDMDFGAIPTPEAVPTAEEQEEIRSREQKQ